MLFNFFRERNGEIRVIVTSRLGRREFGPVIEVDMHSPEFQNVLALTLDKVGAKLKQG